MTADSHFCLSTSQDCNLEHTHQRSPPAVAIVLALLVACFWGVCGAYRRRAQVVQRTTPRPHFDLGESPPVHGVGVCLEPFEHTIVRGPSQHLSTRSCPCCDGGPPRVGGRPCTIAFHAGSMCTWCSAGDIPEVCSVHDQPAKLTALPIIVIQPDNKCASSLLPSPFECVLQTQTSFFVSGQMVSCSRLDTFIDVCGHPGPRKQQAVVPTMWLLPMRSSSRRMLKLCKYQQTQHGCSYTPCRENFISLSAPQALLHPVSNRSIAYTFRELESGKGAAVAAAPPAADSGGDAGAAAASASAAAAVATDRPVAAHHTGGRGAELPAPAVPLDQAASGNGELPPDGATDGGTQSPGVSPRSGRRRSLSLWAPDPVPEAGAASAHPGPSGQVADQGLTSRSAALQALHGAGLLRKVSRSQGVWS